VYEKDGAERDDDRQCADVVSLPLCRRLHRPLAVRPRETGQRHVDQRQRHGQLQTHSHRTLEKMHAGRSVGHLVRGRIAERSECRTGLTLTLTANPNPTNPY